MNESSAFPISRQRCFRHGDREAAARCPECGRFFCRECITEHEDRVLCVACLESRTARDAVSSQRFSGFKRIAQGAAGVFLTWLFFYYLGRILLLLPTAFHEGTLWKAGG